MGYFLLGLSSTKHYEKTSVITSDSLDFHRANSYTNRGNIWNRLYSFLNKLHFMSLHRNLFRIRKVCSVSTRIKEWNMFKFVNKDVSTKSFCWIYCWYWTYSTPCSSVYTINFEQVNVCLKSMSWHSIYIRVEQDHSSTAVCVNFEHMAPSSSVSIVEFEHLNISIVFRLRWIQVPFIYKENFCEIKHFHEVACTPSCLVFLWNLFKVPKLECVKFSNAIYKLFRGNLVRQNSMQGQSPCLNCPGGSFMGDYLCKG